MGTPSSTSRQGGGKKLYGLYSRRGGLRDENEWKQAVARKQTMRDELQKFAKTYKANNGNGKGNLLDVSDLLAK